MGKRVCCFLGFKSCKTLCIQQTNPKCVNMDEICEIVEKTFTQFFNANREIE